MTEKHLTDLASAKRAASEKMLDLATRKATLERDVRARRAGTMAVITAETDANGKPLYTNADKREAACELRLAEDPSHQADLVAIEAISSELAHTRIAYDFDSDMLRIGLAFAGTHPTVMRGMGEGANADF